MTNKLLPHSTSVIRASSFAWWILLALSAISGCGEESDSVAVRGKVFYRGEPLSNAAITFFPNTGRPVTAPLSQQGDYDTALPPGEYSVIVNVGTELPPGFKEGDPLPPPKIDLPPEYTTLARSTLRATVTPDQSEPIDFALE